MERGCLDPLGVEADPWMPRQRGDVPSVLPLPSVAAPVVAAATAAGGGGRDLGVLGSDRCGVIGDLATG
eukprot:2798643-Pyramimonas_sp.AAC.1